MTGTKQIKIPFWATIFTTLGVIALCTLGTWQIQRLAWKEDIIAKLDAAYDNPIKDPDLSDLNDNDFLYAEIRGKFLFEKSILLGHTVKNEKPGQFLITPLLTDQGTLLVNMGFNPKGWALENHFLKSYNNEKISFTGIIRKPSCNSFTPQNSPEENTWYRLDIDQISSAQNLKNPMPFVMIVDFASRKFDAQFPNNERWEPNNNHAQYAFFWFTLASTLVIIYGLRFFRKET